MGVGPVCQLCSHRAAEVDLTSVDGDGPEWMLCRPCLWVNAVAKGSSATQVRGVPSLPTRVMTDGHVFVALRQPPKSLPEMLAAWRDGSARIPGRTLPTESRAAMGLPKVEPSTVDVEPRAAD